MQGKWLQRTRHWVGQRPWLVRLSVWIALAWSGLFLQRIVFAVVYTESELPAVLVLYQLWRGLRFDLATLPLLVVPIVFILPLLGLSPGSVGKRMIKAIEFVQALWLGFAQMILAASSYNFGVNNKHLGWEFWAYLTDLGTLLGSVWEESALRFILFVSYLPISIGVAYYLVFRLGRSLYEANHAYLGLSFRSRALRVAGTVLAVLLFLVIAMRGGIQQSPIRAADAMLHQSAYLNNVPLNALFTITRDIQDQSEFEQFYDPGENTRVVQSMIANEDAFLSESYPLVRYMPPTNTGRPNIVLIVLESFTARYLATHGGDPAIAPNMQRLIDDGYYYERFFASGGRSANGLFCMLAGLPDRAGRTILRSTQIHNRMGGLGTLVKERGYHTAFFHGGDLKFDNLDSVLPHLGFDENVGSAAMAESGQYEARNVWGYHDGDMFDMALHRMDRMPGPFFAVLFTLNTHHPYTIPDESFAYFGENVLQKDFLNSYRYTDHVLGEFMARVRDKPYYSNTVFLFVADHSHHAGINYLEDRHIPFLIYAPGRIPAARNGAIASQLDILPTVVGLAGGDSLYAAMGNDLRPRAPARKAFAFFAGGSNTNLIGWIEGDHMLVRLLGTHYKGLLSARPPVTEEELSAQMPERAEQYLARAQHYHQFARTLEMENRIWPTNEELVEINARARDRQAATPPQ